LHGRNALAYGRPAKSAAERFDYAYTCDELQALARQFDRIARSVKYAHALFNNCMEDKAQRNAKEFLEALKNCLQHQNGYS
jgi:YD repeat-containing protein